MLLSYISIRNADCGCGCGCGRECVAWSPGDDFTICCSAIYSKLLRVFLPQYVARGREEDAENTKRSLCVGVCVCLGWQEGQVHAHF